MRNTTAGHFTPHTSPEEYREMLEGDELVAGTDQVLFPCAHTFQNDILRWYIENGVPTRKPCMFCKNPWSNQSSISTLPQPDAESMARFWETHAPPSVAFKEAFIQEAIQFFMLKQSLTAFRMLDCRHTCYDMRHVLRTLEKRYPEAAPVTKAIYAQTIVAEVICSFSKCPLLMP